MKKLFDKFNGLNGASFISINNYLAKTSGELANHRLNVNISVKNAKETDLNRLRNCTDKDLEMISKASNIDFETCKQALSEMLASAEKNLSENIEDRTNQSKGQSDAFITLTKNGSVKLHKDTLAVHIFGMHIDKTVLVKGEYKQVKSKPKTLAKKAITKHLDLRAEKFRTFILANADNLKVSGDVIEI